MDTSTQEQLTNSKRLLRGLLKQKGSNHAEIMMALQAIEEQEESGVDNATMMKDANGNEIFYMLIEKNPIKRCFQYIQKIVFELLGSRKN